ncbi:MAG: glycoside hydrolase [Planctomycetota bacterium]|nr:MAG: glycoside hydrolase [Planctomycetota bacterium]
MPFFPPYLSKIRRLFPPNPWLFFPPIASFCLWLALSPPKKPKPPSPFVQVKNGHFLLKGKKFFFSGANNYYLHYASYAAIDDVLKSAVKMRLKVLRCFAFLDGVKKNGLVIQPRLGTYRPEGLERLDYTIMQAKKLGLKLILVLTNNWPDFGGIPQYEKWGISKQHFWQNPRHFQNYISFILHHKNIYTGTRYKDDPTIMAWELCNEPRWPADPSGRTITSWTKKVATFLRSIDPNHLIALGDEGFLQIQSSDWTYSGKMGVDWEAVLALKAIDFGTLHLWPNDWKKSLSWSIQWLKDHLDIGRRLGKPVVLEEYGWRSFPQRDGIYRQWNELIYRQNGAGMLVWLLTGKDGRGKLYPNYDGYRVIYPSSTAQILREYAKKMAEKS